MCAATTLVARRRTSKRMRWRRAGWIGMRRGFPPSASSWTTTSWIAMVTACSMARRLWHRGARTGHARDQRRGRCRLCDDHLLRRRAVARTGGELNDCSATHLPHDDDDHADDAAHGERQLERHESSRNDVRLRSMPRPASSLSRNHRTTPRAQPRRSVSKRAMLSPAARGSTAAASC